MLKVVEKRDEREAGEELLRLDEIAREGARRMLIEALKAEVDDYGERHRGERDEQGHALVVRNGRARTRKLTLGAGTVELNVIESAFATVRLRECVRLARARSINKLCRFRWRRSKLMGVQQ